MAVAVSVAVGVLVAVAVAVDVLVGVTVEVAVGVLVAVAVGVLVGVSVGVLVGVSVTVGVSVGSCALATPAEVRKSPAAATVSTMAKVLASGHTPCGRRGTSSVLLSRVRVIIDRNRGSQ